MRQPNMNMSLLMIGITVIGTSSLSSNNSLTFSSSSSSSSSPSTFKRSTVPTRIPSTRLKDSFDDYNGIIANKNLSLSSYLNQQKSNRNSNSTTKKRKRGTSFLSSSGASSSHPTGTSPAASSSSAKNLLSYSKQRINHRHSSNDWLHNLLSIPKSTVLREIRNPLISIATWSTLVSFLHKALASHTKLSHIASKMAIGTQMHSLMISSLGLLLVFRTNSAYQRFVEGRKIWEQILSISRNIDRMTHLYYSEIGHAKVHRIKHYLASFPYLLRHHIRPSCLGCDDTTPREYRIRMEEIPHELEDTAKQQHHHKGVDNNNHISNIDEGMFEHPNYCWADRRKLPWRLLDDKTLSKCTNAINRPLWACNSIADEIINIPYGPNFTSRERLTLISQVDKLSNAIGQCERIHQTAVPLNYARHALRSLSLWLFTLPFALVKDLGLLTGPICAITAWLMFGVYQIGHSIEDPFQKTLRLSILCNDIRRDVLGENQYKYRNSLSSLNNAKDDHGSNTTLEELKYVHVLKENVNDATINTTISTKATTENHNNSIATLDVAELTEAILPTSNTCTPFLYNNSGSNNILEQWTVR